MDKQAVGRMGRYYEEGADLISELLSPSGSVSSLTGDPTVLSGQKAQGVHDQRKEVRDQTGSRSRLPQPVETRVNRPWRHARRRPNQANGLRPRDSSRRVERKLGLTLWVKKVKYGVPFQSGPALSHPPFAHVLRTRRPANMRLNPNVPSRPGQTASPRRGTRHVSLPLTSPRIPLTPLPTTSKLQATKQCAVDPRPAEGAAASQSLPGVLHAPRPARRPPADESEAPARPHGARDGPRPGDSKLRDVPTADIGPEYTWVRQPLPPSCLGKLMIETDGGSGTWTRAWGGRLPHIGHSRSAGKRGGCSCFG